MKYSIQITLLLLAILVAGCFSPGLDGEMHKAVISGSLADVQSLVGGGADVNATGAYGCTPLYYAALYGDSYIVTYLLGKGADPKKGASWRGGDTPLHVAAQCGYVDCVQVLLSNGVPVDLRNNYGETALHLAARRRNTDVVRLLLSNGADANATDKRGGTPLEYPSGFVDNRQLNYQETVEILIEHGADVRHIDRNGEAAIHEAVFLGNVKVVEILLQHGAIPNVSGTRGTPLAWAQSRGYKDIVLLLQKNGAKQ